MRERFETVEIPVHVLADGRQFIGDTDIFTRPEVAEFVRRFGDHWTRDHLRMGFVGPRPARDKQPGNPTP